MFIYTSMTPSNRVVIIGSGNVGSSVAYCLINKEIVRDILMIDIATDLVNAQVLDMKDSSDFTNGVDINVGSYSDLQDGDIVVITCGAAQKEGQTRLDLLNTNTKIIRSVISEIKNTEKNVYIIMVTNPVDVLTYIAVKESGLPSNQVFGSGTYLDSARLRVHLSHKLDVGPTSVHAHILGEHGDTSFPALSSANVSTIDLSEMLVLDEDLYQSISTEVRGKAYEIIQGKGSTYFGIGSAVTRIIESIIKDERKVMPLSVVLNGEYGYSDVSISVPVVIGINGVKILHEVRLNELERDMLDKSVNTLKEYIQKITI